MRGSCEICRSLRLYISELHAGALANLRFYINVATHILEYMIYIIMTRLPFYECHLHHHNMGGDWGDSFLFYFYSLGEFIYCNEGDRLLPC